MAEPCADRCTEMADLIVRTARAEGRSEREVRVSLGLSPIFVPPIPRRTYRCPDCGRDDWTSSLAAEACCNFIESD